MKAVFFPATKNYFYKPGKSPGSTLLLMQASFSYSGQRLSDHTLWEKYVQGDRDAFGVLYSRYHKSLTAYCIGRLKDRTLAENAASDTLLKLLNHANPESIDNFESWLFAVAKNECNTYWSTVERREELLKKNYEVEVERRPEVEDRFSSENMDQLIRSNLDETDYRIWQLYREGYDNDEVANMMSLNEKTVANRKSAARMKLKNVLKKYGADER
ncbi:MAG TPA: RNA polymerase sigma factor [Cyclobacteriaceae bacterium]|nr:RNA polymerase sigma factor [Cyclobacteriaceae bacterium]